MGIVESVSLTAKGENGVASFPAVVKVDNPDGSLMTGMYVNYSFVASQSDDCLTVPVQAVKYVSFAGIEGFGGTNGDGMTSGTDGMGDGAIADDGAVVDEEAGGDAEAAPQSYAGGASANRSWRWPCHACGRRLLRQLRRRQRRRHRHHRLCPFRADAGKRPCPSPDPSWSVEGFWRTGGGGLADTTRVEITAA